MSPIALKQVSNFHISLQYCWTLSRPVATLPVSSSFTQPCCLILIQANCCRI